MFDRFTDRARKVMNLAKSEAQRLNHEYIGTEHILLGLVQEGSGVAANVLRNMGIDLKRIRAEIEKLVKGSSTMVPMGNLPFTPQFDRVLVDAPCSGLGTIRRDPDIRWRRHEHDLEGFARNQLVLLERAASLVRSGGRLVYATCSSEPEENEAVVESFLSCHQEFEVVDLRADGALPLRPLLNERGMLHTLPFAHGLEAFFAAALVLQSRAG